MADMLTEYKPNRPLRSLGSSQLEILRNKNVKHFELPMCMKCAIQINLPCLVFKLCTGGLNLTKV